jgi:hypothetical protein
MRSSLWVVGLLASVMSCESSSDGDPTPSDGAGTGGQAAPTGGATGGVSVTGGTTSSMPTGGATGGNATGGANVGGTTGGAAPSGGTAAGGTASGGGAGMSVAGGGAAAGGGTAGGSGGGEGGGVAGQAGGPSGGSGGSTVVNNCMGKAWTTADPTKAGPFQVAADKNVGPLAGELPDPIYMDKQQRFNVYRPSNLADTGYCHPILIWANGYRDNPEQKPPDCVVDQGANRWCGQYGPMVNHLASHGFVVVASLSTRTADGSPMPPIVGLNWILEQAEDPSSPYYHRLDTSNIGQLGHSYGGMATCMAASEPRYKALATICGTRALTGVHTPMLFFCGGKDSTVPCEGDNGGVKAVFKSVTDQPAFFLNEKNADHGSWVYQGAGGVSLSAAAAWFRVHLMNDTANRKFFYGSGCTFCNDNRVEAEQNSLMMQ